MFHKIQLPRQLKIILVLQLTFWINYSTAFLNEKTGDMNLIKYEDIYDYDKLQNVIWMNVFGSYPTVNTEVSKNNASNQTRHYSLLLKLSENLKFLNDQEKNSEDKSAENIDTQKLKLANFKITRNVNFEKSLLETIEDSSSFQNCLRTIHSPETCLVLILKSNNFSKILENKYICFNSPTWTEFRQCLLQFSSYDNKIPVLNKNKKVIDAPKRLPFHAWGGKRINQVGTEKVQTSRVPFNAWGGKRSDYEQNYNSYLESCEPCKRSKFHSWGGKRSKRKTHV